MARKIIVAFKKSDNHKLNDVVGRHEGKFVVQDDYDQNFKRILPNTVWEVQIIEEKNQTIIVKAIRQKDYICVTFSPFGDKDILILSPERGRSYICRKDQLYDFPVIVKEEYYTIKKNNIKTDVYEFIIHSSTKYTFLSSKKVRTIFTKEKLLSEINPCNFKSIEKQLKEIYPYRFFLFDKIEKHEHLFPNGYEILMIKKGFNIKKRSNKNIFQGKDISDIIVKVILEEEGFYTLMLNSDYKLTR